jgi:DNA polymerase epsilon subunit 2
LDRYTTILQRTKRNFQQKLAENDSVKLELQTVDYLLTLSYVSLNHTLILGSLLQVSEGKYYLEDPTGMVQLDLTHAV